MPSTSRLAATVAITLSLCGFISHAAAQPPVVQYLDRSAETGMQYIGNPRNATPLNFNADEYSDLFITLFDYPAIGYEGYDISQNGAPMLEDATIDIFPSSSAPTAGTTGLIVGDYDNDGHVDLFACDYGGGAKLYRNMGGASFADVTTSSGLAALLGSGDNVNSASWADIDGDGDLDLTVVRGSNWEDQYGGALVLRNEGGTFTSVALAEFGPAGHTPLWADFDSDGDLDLVILKSHPDPVSIPPPGYANFFYVNQGDGTFVDDGWDRIGIVSGLIGGAISAVCDFDNDGDLDIVYMLEGYDVVLLENDTASNPGLGYFHPRLLCYGTGSYLPTDVAILDYDLDGYQDVLIGIDGSTRLLGNRSGSGGARILADETAVAGIAASGWGFGLAPADYNHDGFTDLYLTRPASLPFFYKASPAAGQSQATWAGVRLSSPYGANNTQGLGATVTVTAGTETYVQVVDGGSGYASQRHSDLVFGLGSHSGTVDIEVRWPAGRTQTVTGVTTGQYITVVDDSPVIDRSSVAVEKVYHLLTDTLDWIFVWETWNDCPTSLDKVSFDLDDVPGRCLPPAAVLTDQTSGVTVTKIDLGGGKFEHTLTLSGVDCEARCSLPYVIESAVSDYTSTSDLGTFKVAVCVQSL